MRGMIVCAEWIQEFMKCWILELALDKNMMDNGLT